MRAESGLRERLSVYVCVRLCLCVCVCVTFLLSTSKFKPFVWIKSRASARGKHGGGLNNSTFYWLGLPKAQYGAIIKLDYSGTLRIGFCDTIQASAAHTAR